VEFFLSSLEAVSKLLTKVKFFSLIGPLITVFAGSIPLLLLKTGVATSLVIDEDQLGPHSWPRVMLICLIGFGTLWGVTRWRVISSEGDTTSDLEQHDSVKLVLGILSVIVYGAAITLIGFAFSTFLFLLCWFLLGGIRNFLTIPQEVNLL
jgi:hypothetical protein